MYAPLPNQPGSRNINMLERWFSMIGGGALTTMGLRRGGILGLLFSLGGGYLVQRGLTGHCAFYQALGMNTSGGSASGYSSYQPTQSAEYNQEDTQPMTSQARGEHSYDMQADQAEGERQPERRQSTRVGRTPGSAEGDRETVEADLRAKRGSQ